MSYLEHIQRVIGEASHLDSRVLKNGTHLIGNIPHIAPQAYLHVTYPPLDDEQIDALERNMGIPLPVELRNFYHFSNGIDLFANKITIYGLRTSYVRVGDEAWQPFCLVSYNTDERPIGAPELVVFLGGYRFDGSKLGMSAEGPEVYRFAPGTGQVLNTWPSFDTMMTSEIERLSQLFDRDGKLIDPDAPTAPQPDVGMN